MFPLQKRVGCAGLAESRKGREDRRREGGRDPPQTLNREPRPPPLTAACSSTRREPVNSPPNPGP